MRLLEFANSVSLCQYLVTLNKVTGFQDLTGFDNIQQDWIESNRNEQD